MSAATLVTGARGTTGSRLTARLLAAGHRVKAASRRPAPIEGAEAIRFDWYRPETYAETLRDVDRMYLLPPVGDPDPAAVMLPFLEQARTAGARRAVLLSSSAVPAGGPAVGQVHQRLADLFDQWAVLRPSWFMQNFTGEHMHARAIREEGRIMTATGTGRVGFVDADDIAAVAARALTDEDAPDEDLVLTGPEALAYDDVAAIVTEVTGRPVTHRNIGYEQMRERLETVAPPDFAALLAEMDLAIANGAEDRTTDTVERLTGRPPNGLREVIARELGRLPGRPPRRARRCDPPGPARGRHGGRAPLRRVRASPSMNEHSHLTILGGTLAPAAAAEPFRADRLRTARRTAHRAAAGFELIRSLALDAVFTSAGAARLGARSPIRTGRRSHGEGSVALAA